MAKFMVMWVSGQVWICFPQPQLHILKLNTFDSKIFVINLYI